MAGRPCGVGAGAVVERAGRGGAPEGAACQRRGLPARVRPVSGTLSRAELSTRSALGAHVFGAQVCGAEVFATVAWMP